METISAHGEMEGLGLFSVKETQGDMIAASSKEGWGDGAKLFPEAHRDGHQSHTAMRQTPARYRDKSVTAGGMQHVDTLPREDGGSPSLEV